MRFMVFERRGRVGGKLRTLPFGKENRQIIDLGYSQLLEGGSLLYMEILREIEQAHILTRVLSSPYSKYKGKENKNIFWMAPNGIEGVAKYLCRWANIHLSKEVVGLTRLTHSPSRNYVWAINMSDSSVFHADMVLIATSVDSAIDLLSSTANEYSVEQIIPQLEKVNYIPSLALAIRSWADNIPSWKQMFPNHKFISHIANESLLRQDRWLNLVVYFHPRIYKEYLHGNWDLWKHDMIRESLSIIDVNALYPMYESVFILDHNYLKKSLSTSFLDIPIKGAPLACIGDYFLEGGLLGAAKSVSGILSKWF